jgi:hypothetical protein
VRRADTEVAGLKAAGRKSAVGIRRGIVGTIVVVICCRGFKVEYLNFVGELVISEVRRERM